MNIPSQKVIDAGDDLMSDLYDATIQKSLGCLGGCKEFDINSFKPEHQPYIEMYLNDKADSMTLTYMFMKKVEIEEYNNETH